MTIYSPSFSNTSKAGRKTESWPRVRSDSAIEEEIWDRLSKENREVFSPEHISVEVKDGQVRLSGHVPEEWQRQQVKAITAQVHGVTQIWNDIVQDRDLRARVMRALSKDERTTMYLVPVKCTHGWISLGGIVPSQEAAETIETVAASVPDVRGILSIPWVVGLSWNNPEQKEFVRRTFQPRIGATVHEDLVENQPASKGIVSRVVLDPTSRLLTHIVVQTREDGVDGNRIRERLIPVEAMEAGNREHVWLKMGEVICQYPIFQAYRYPGVPQDWRPPFPYKPEMVRWSNR